MVAAHTNDVAQAIRRPRRDLGSDCRTPAWEGCPAV